MPRKISSSQLRSKLRQAENKRKQAINKYNRAVREYNQAVRSYNSRARANRQRLNSELAKLRRLSTKQSTSTRHVLFRSSAYRLHEVYVNLEEELGNESLGPQYDEILDLSERENANSLEILNVLLSDNDTVVEASNPLGNTVITNELGIIS
ncbi:MAG: hypothetical protein KF770_08500, partial [Anaerolineae bacterium]|nr:hypothetical protein [Anaerolineae bacterium]